MTISHAELIAGIQPKINRKQRQRIGKEIRSQGKAASYARFSSAMQNESSNDDQHRRNEQEAVATEHSIAPENRYSDLAISGTKIERDGLHQLIADAESGKFSTIYFFSLSRLARESLIGMSILKKLVCTFGVRVISVSEGIDTDRSGWEMFRSNRGSRGNPARHLLSNLLYCQCGHKFYIGGAHGKYLFCPNYKRGTCKCKTNVRKDLATRLLLELITNAVRQDDAWLDATYRATISAWERSTSLIPDEVASLQRSLESIDRKINQLLDRIENGNDEIAVGQRLNQRQQERQEILSQLSDLSRQQVDKPDPPTKEWVRGKLQGLVENSPATDPALIDAVHALLGGQVKVLEVHPEKGRPHLRGEVTLRVSAATKMLIGIPNAGNEVSDVSDVVVFIDFIDPDPAVVFTALSDHAKALYDQDLMNAQIAKSLGVCRSMATKLLQHWFNSRGLTMPDGRARRSTLAEKHLEAPFYQQISDQVKTLLDQGFLLGQIAESISCDRNTVTSAARFWFESRGLEYLDGRARRKLLGRTISE